MQITIDIGNATIDHALGVLRVGGIDAKIVAETTTAASIEPEKPAAPAAAA